MDWIETYAKDCAKNYKNGVEFSVKFIYGGMESTYNFPRGIKELQYMSNSRLRQTFIDCLDQFMEKVERMYPDGKQQLRVQYLPLQSKSTQVITTFGK